MPCRTFTRRSITRFTGKPPHKRGPHGLVSNVARFRPSTTPGEYAAQRERLIGGLRPEVQGAIDRFQSCDTDPEPAAAKLRLLNQLSRIDRHRLLHVTALRLENVGLRARAPGRQDPESPLDPPPDDGTSYVDVRMTLGVRFADGPAAGENIIHTLNDLTLAVAATIEKLRVVGGESVS